MKKLLIALGTIGVLLGSMGVMAQGQPDEHPPTQALPFAPLLGNDGEPRPMSGEWHEVGADGSIWSSGHATIYPAGVDDDGNITGFGAVFSGTDFHGNDVHDAQLFIYGEDAYQWMVEDRVNPDTNALDQTWFINPETRQVQEYGLPLCENPYMEMGVLNSTGAVGVYWLCDHHAFYLFANGIEFLPAK